MEFAGSPSAVREQAQTMAEIAEEHGGQHFNWAEQPEDRSRLWKARHRAYLSGLKLRPGCRAITTDVCVPISRLADCVLETIAEANASGIPYFVVGHVGDGNFHMCYLLDPNNPQELEIGEQLNHHVVQRAIRMEGTCSGEHGVGLHKQAFLIEETGASAVAMMRSIKHALDPDNIMNPGKVFTW
jgi:D-lactate dehydrogenase (cytochrome)